MTPRIRLRKTDDQLEREREFQLRRVVRRLTELVSARTLRFPYHFAEGWWAKTEGFGFAVDLLRAGSTSPEEAPHQPRLRVYQLAWSPRVEKSQRPIFTLVGGPELEHLYRAVSDEREEVSLILDEMIRELEAA